MLNFCLDSLVKYKLECIYTGSVFRGIHSVGAVNLSCDSLSPALVVQKTTKMCIYIL